MRRSPATFFCCLGLLAAAVPAASEPTKAPAATAPAPGAETPPAPTMAENGRFAMTPTSTGFLRLDTRSGGVSFCTVSGDAAQCRSSADERAALEAEIARLSDENARLRARAPAAAGAQQAPTSLAPLLSDLPKDVDVDRALGLLGKVVKGVVKIMKDVDTESN